MDHDPEGGRDREPDFAGADGTGPEPAVDGTWWRRPLEELVDHIVRTFHRPLRRELPALIALSDRVAERHRGGGQAEPLDQIREALAAIWSEVETHLGMEEKVVFPWILAQGEGAAGKDDPDTPVGLLRHDHRFVYRALGRLRSLTGGYRALPVEDPEGPELALRIGRLDADLRRHQLLEDEVLLPRAQGEPAPAAG